MNYSDDLDAMIESERHDELLAGTGIAARRARYNAKRKTSPDALSGKACPEGHEYTEDTTYINAAGRRLCMICHAGRRVHKNLSAGRASGGGRREVIDLDAPMRDIPPAGTYEIRSKRYSDQPTLFDLDGHGQVIKQTA